MPDGAALVSLFTDLPQLESRAIGESAVRLAFTRYVSRIIYGSMIRSFADGRTEVFFLEGKCPAPWKGIAKVAARKLDMVDATVRLSDLRSPPGNRLERLKRDRAGQWSIRINDKWRICFRWTGEGPDQVEITDYH